MWSERIFVIQFCYFEIVYVYIPRCHSNISRFQCWHDKKNRILKQNFFSYCLTVVYTLKSQTQFYCNILGKPSGIYIANLPPFDFGYTDFDALPSYRNFIRSSCVALLSLIKNTSHSFSSAIYVCMSLKHKSKIASIYL